MPKMTFYKGNLILIGFLLLSYITETVSGGPECITPLGMESGTIKSSQIHVSSASPGKEMDKARLNCCKGESVGAWCPDKSDAHPWYQIDFNSAQAFGGLLFQHPARKDENILPDTFMTSFALRYKSPFDSSNNWLTYNTDIPSIYNSSTAYSIQLLPPVVATAVRLYPRKYQNAPCFRMELLGCDPKGLCSENFCKNGGECMGQNLCKCKGSFYGDRCDQQVTKIRTISVDFTNITHSILHTTSQIFFHVYGNASVENSSIGKVVHLQGDNDCLQIDKNSLTSCVQDIDSCSSGFTLTLNVKFRILADNTYIVTSGGDLNGYSGISLFYSKGTINYYVTTKTQTWRIQINNTFTLNVWHKIELTWNKILGSQIFDNGKLIGSTSQPLQTIPATQTLPIQIGECNTNRITPLDFKIANVRIFEANRDVLVDNSLLTSTELPSTTSVPPTTKSYCDSKQNNLTFLSIDGNIVYTPSYNFSMYNSPRLTPEKDGSAFLELTKKGQYVELPNVGLECIQDMTSCDHGFTLSIEVKFHDLNSTDKLYILSAGGDQVNSSGIALYLWKGELYCSAKKDRTIWTAKQKLDVNVEEWHTFQVSWNKKVGFIVYLDGNKFMEHSIRLPNPAQNDTHALLIGTSPGYNNTVLMDVRHLYTWSSSRDELIKEGCIQDFLTTPKSTTSSSATTTTTPPLPQRSDISCNADSIDTFVPISMLPSGAPLTWRDPTCSVTSNGTHMISSIGLSQCGTTVTITKDNVEFENELKAQSTNSTANSLIDFGEDAYVIPVKCIYPRTETPMTSYVPLQQHVRFYEKRYGHFDVDIMQYDSDKFSSAIQNLGTPRKVALNSEIYVEVKLNDQFNNGLGIHIDKCIATPTSSPSDSTLYTLLTDGCPASQHVHLYNSPANKVRFGVRAFQFTSQTGAMVYIHCQTSMCQAGTPYCTSNCVTAGRRKRDVAPDQKSHLVSAGPFVLVADEQGTPIRMSTIVASVSAFVAVVACVVAIVGWTRKTRTTSTKEQGLL